MGIKDHENYGAAGTGSDVEGSEEDLPRLRTRGWSAPVRKMIYEWTAPRSGGVGGDGHATGVVEGLADRVGRCWGSFVEGVPAFTRGLLVGGTREWVTLVLSVLCVFTVFHSLMQPTRLVSSLVPAPALCASQDDMYDTSTKMCKVGNKYAEYYLKHRSWVQCAPNVPGYRMLMSSGADWGGNYWYTLQQSSEIRMFYDTCIPECATDEDTYHTNADLCAVSDDVLVTFLNGDGQRCGSGTVGEKAIRSATAAVATRQGGNKYWYAPDASGKVRELLESCHGTCAKRDEELHDHVHCQVMNTLALKFLSGQGGTCDRRLPGYRLIGSSAHTKDMRGSYVYAKSTGSEMEDFYLSCMKGWDRSRHGFGSVPHEAETVKGKSLAVAAAADRQRKEWKAFDKAASMEGFN